jgi:hypothetical protein
MNRSGIFRVKVNLTPESTRRHWHRMQGAWHYYYPNEKCQSAPPLSSTLRVVVRSISEEYTGPGLLY